MYNYDACWEWTTNFVVLVEGVPDVLRAAEAGVTAVAAFGTDLSSFQTQKLANLNKRVFVAFDNDEAGATGARTAASQLQEAGVKTVVRHPPAEYKDVGEMPATAVTEWLGLTSSGPLDSKENRQDRWAVQTI